ncbi:MAG TPA: hypothetical protein PKC24_01250 [Cyclobacteriaceae bacterium]|nr:hypothetical protein [Cyclobacteriaceae bacterium]
MRTVKLMMIAALFVISANALAKVANDEKVPATLAVVEYKKTGIYKVIYKGEKSGKVKLSIYDAKHNLVFTENLVKTNAFMRPYNFSGMPEGIYFIEIEGANGKLVERVQFTGGRIEKTVNVTRLTGKDTRYLLTVAAKEQDEITIRVFDETDHLVHEETATIDGDFAKVYNLQKLNGRFTMQITDKYGVVKSLKY